MGTSLDEALTRLDSAPQRCPFGHWIDELDDDYRAKVNTALARIVHNREVNGKTAQGATAPWLAKALQDDGHKWSADSIAHHLRGQRGAGCRCRD